MNGQGQWKVGAARTALPVGQIGQAMMGWAQPSHVIRGIAEPLHARCMVLEPARGPACAIVVVDYSSVSARLREAICAKLAAGRAPALAGDALMVLATHTHSGPGGYLDGLLFQLVNPYDPDLVDEAARSIALALEDAWQQRLPATLMLHEETVPLSAPIAFIRSLHAHHRNPELQGATPDAEAATHRSHTVLVARGPSGEPIAALSFFASHGTCVHSDLHLVHPDHKAMAARSLDARMESPRFVSLFAQESAGDVTPNHRFDRKRGVNISAWDDDYEAAARVGALEADSAKRALDAPGVSLDATAQADLRLLDFAKARSGVLLADGSPERTGPPVLGVSMMLGTAEGQGPLFPLRRVLGRWGLWRSRRAARRLSTAYAAIHGGKVHALDLGEVALSQALGTFPARWLRFVPPYDGYARGMRRVLRTPQAQDGVWVSSSMPLQVLELGSLLVVGLPFEPTTQVGRRLRRHILSLPGLQGRRAVVAGYANDFAGYLTTPEEYDAQAYEGGFTLYGRATLPCIQAALSAALSRKP
jgi:neutral ceramidase